mmetsp:Transcript_1012/g.1554  ORF Transcript_1012/g.1554 Transcript_1012/m.1554 type:complete len:130 (+) Transcript_1012:1633-2022(+)
MCQFWATSFHQMRGDWAQAPLVSRPVCSCATRRGCLGAPFSSITAHSWRFKRKELVPTTFDYTASMRIPRGTWRALYDAPTCARLAYRTIGTPSPAMFGLGVVFSTLVHSCHLRHATFTYHDTIGWART